jgi:DNA (cytosine-5)-methyltransferase 1
VHVRPVVYNEIDPFAAAWLQNLSAGGHIASGSVDTRSVEDIRPEEVAATTQFHTFAGIGVWSYALRLAGWPDDRPVWTGSCPCQPFSSAGKRAGFADERHLWPAWFRLIRECRPPVIFGEQVASKDGLAWLDTVYADLEGAGYAVGAVDLCAAGVGAPHIRQRLFFVAERITDSLRERPATGLPAEAGRHARDAEESRDGMGGRSGSGARRSETHGLADDDDDDGRGKRQRNDSTTRYGDTASAARSDDRSGAPSPTNGHWSDPDWLYCRDGKWRPVESGTFPLAHGAPARVGRLRGYGNAIVAQVAAEVIRAYMDV